MENKLREKIKIYIRSGNKIYVYINDEILLYEDEDLTGVLENLKSDYGFDEKYLEGTVILHFSYFLFNMEKENKIWNKVKKALLYRKEKFYLNFNENNFIYFFLEKKKINEIKGIFRKNRWKVEKIKIDFDCLYNYFKNENTEILQIGENESIRLLIEDRKITEVEKIGLKIDDLENIGEFDFGDMKVKAAEEEDIKNIFLGEELYNAPDFISGHEKNISKKNIRIRDIITAVLLLSVYSVINVFIPVSKENKKNEEIKNEIKLKENEYLKKKNEELPNYSEELKILGDISDSMKRREYYSLIKFFIDNSIYGIDYTKIEYEDKKWTVQGEISNFNLFEKFENNIEKKYTGTELGYIKDEDSYTIFEYVIWEK